METMDIIELKNIQNTVKKEIQKDIPKAKRTYKKKEPTLDNLKEQIRQIKTIYRELETNSKNTSLRWMMKNDGIAIHSNRGKLQGAIDKHRQRINAIILVQRIFRGFLVRLFWRKFKKGKSVSQCVNQTDFYTLEPLDEIDNNMLYFYRSGVHLYGFSLNSLLIYYAKSRFNHKNQLFNPYNRELIDRKDIKQQIVLTNMLFPNSLLEIVNKPHYIIFMVTGELSRRNRTQSLQNEVFTQPPVNQVHSNDEIIIPQVIYNTITNTITEEERPAVIYNSPIISGEFQQSITGHLAEIEQLPILRRIHELFIDFDLLGNYTDAQWFFNQRLRGYKVYFVKLQELWNNLPPFVQQSICCVGDPFYLVNVQNIHRQTFHSMREACVKVMEYITHGGLTREDQKLGIYQLLIALTFISREARHCMNYLL